MSQNTINNYYPSEYSFSERKPLRCTSLHHSIQLNSNEESERVFNNNLSNETNFLQGYETNIYENENNEYIIHGMNDKEAQNSSSDEERGINQVEEKNVYFTDYEANISRINKKEGIRIEKKPFLLGENNELNKKRMVSEFYQKELDDIDLFTMPYVQSDAIKRVVIRNNSLIPKPKMIQRIAESLLEESSPADSEIKNEALLSEILRKSRYIGGCINSYNNIQKKELNDINNNSFITSIHKNDLHSREITDLFPVKKPSSIFQQKPNTDWTVKSNPMLSPSPIKNFMQNVRTSKRKVNSDERFEPYLSFKRRAVSPSLGSSSPTLTTNSSPLSSKFNIFPMQDTNDSLMKMSLQ
ncbi:hypothetical protein T552_00775 [Pneumocystis carinii B80]|uniref:Uncharacterized protein n=1 Tax=Pneumocystis carinii (strain B80) TaxID=1408658 RepID=A0A0W4ZPK4_PNEC8|nr:hypothetical protein T552_00775 [Pneumocystis carinii B80]KTW30300.1 hypothetical protein T552_00775 [Pneumocystis carinii B80]